MSIVYTGGTFDLFHAGHVDFLRVCHKIAGDQGQVVVALNPDAFVERFKGRKPVMSYGERRAVLESCRYVTEVVENASGSDSKPTIEKVYPDFLVIGDDWAHKDYYKQMNFTPEWLDERDISLLYVPRQRDLSSTQVKSRVA